MLLYIMSRPSLYIYDFYSMKELSLSIQVTQYYVADDFKLCWSQRLSSIS